MALAAKVVLVTAGVAWRVGITVDTDGCVTATVVAAGDDATGTDGGAVALSRFCRRIVRTESEEDEVSGTETRAHNRVCLRRWE